MCCVLTACALSFHCSILSALCCCEVNVYYAHHTRFGLRSGLLRSVWTQSQTAAVNVVCLVVQLFDVHGSVVWQYTLLVWSTLLITVKNLSVLFHRLLTISAVPIIAHYHKKLSYRRDSARCGWYWCYCGRCVQYIAISTHPPNRRYWQTMKRPFKVTQGHPLLWQSTCHIKWLPISTQ